MVTRIVKWRDALNEEIGRASSTPFKYGENDCGLFVGSCVLAMTGLDLISKVRGKYSDADGARRALTELGYPSLEDVVKKYLVGVSRSMARVGDVAVLAGSEGFDCALGILVGGLWIGAVASTGYATYPPGLILRAYGVG